MTQAGKTMTPISHHSSFPMRVKPLMMLMIVLWTSLFWGCSQRRLTALPSHEEKQAVGVDFDKEALLNRLIQMEERVKGIKAVQVVHVLNKLDGRTLDAQGLLALERPDRYRLRLLSSLGLTLLEFVLCREEFRFRMPSKGIDIFGKKEEAGQKIPYFPVEALREAFVHSYEADFIEWHPRERTYLLILHRKGGISLIKRWIDREDLTLVKEAFIREKGEELVIDYGDYRSHGKGKSLRLPYRIDIHLPREGVRLEIKVIKYEVNPTFHEKMFDLT